VTLVPNEKNMGAALPPPPSAAASTGRSTGTGPYDIARDLVDLVGLYREHAAGLRNKIPFTDAWFAEAEAVGTWLMANITPTGAPKVSADAADAAALLRDQLWAMLLERDVKLRVVAAVLFEAKAATIVPPLQSRAATASAGSPAAEEEKPAEPVVTEPVTPGNSTPPAPMRPKSAQTRETRATARRRR
jgi:hypothetical protein